MVAESSRNFIATNSKGLNAKELEDLCEWIRPLQQALTLEADKGFNNILGRECYFHDFITRQLLSPPEFLSKFDIVQDLQELSHLFSQYLDFSEARRRRLLARTRRMLHDLNSKFQPIEQISHPKLRVSENNNLKDRRNLKSVSNLSLDSPLISVKGIGVKTAERLSNLGLFVIKDLLKYYPRDYVDYSSLMKIGSLEIGKTATIVATVRRCNVFTSPKNKYLSVLELYLYDQTGRIKVSRFFVGKKFSNQFYLKQQRNIYPQGAIVAVSGLVKQGPYGININDPLIEVMENRQTPIRSEAIGRLLAVYSLTEGLKGDTFRSIISYVLPLAGYWPEPLKKERLKELALPTRSEAIISIHQPNNREALLKARRRLVFDEFLLMQLGFLKRRADLRQRLSPTIEISWHHESLVSRFIQLLPFPLTKAQERVLNEIKCDLDRREPMSRLLQGDVGSGKTVVAIAALLSAVESGCQGALMAPTEVLAEQHYQTLLKWLIPLHVTVDLITGSSTKVQ